MKAIQLSLTSVTTLTGTCGKATEKVEIVPNRRWKKQETVPNQLMFFDSFYIFRCNCWEKERIWKAQRGANLIWKQFARLKVIKRRPSVDDGWLSPPLLPCRRLAFLNLVNLLNQDCNSPADWPAHLHLFQLTPRETMNLTNCARFTEYLLGWPLLLIITILCPCRQI